ncbi:hypothetical protein HK101_008284 [Irineochytrium annulatum]|nr:hypothetical protein HK101_008284 [Irineochytrium annulatum]
MSSHDSRDGMYTDSDSGSDCGTSSNATSQSYSVSNLDGKSTRKGKNVGTACTECKKSHLACDQSRPCKRCQNLKKLCVNVIHMKRGRPRSHGHSKHSLEDLIDIKNTGISESDQEMLIAAVALGRLRSSGPTKNANEKANHGSTSDTSDEDEYEGNAPPSFGTPDFSPAAEPTSMQSQPDSPTSAFSDAANSTGPAVTCYLDSAGNFCRLPRDEVIQVWGCDPISLLGQSFFNRVRPGGDLNRMTAMHQSLITDAQSIIVNNRMKDSSTHEKERVHILVYKNQVEVFEPYDVSMRLTVICEIDTMTQHAVQRIYFKCTCVPSSQFQFKY